MRPPLHDHPPKAACPPSCPGWAEGSLRLLAYQRRHAEMLEACRAAAAIETLAVAPATQGVVLPDYLRAEDVVRLNLVVGRDTPEVLLDEWGVRCNLTFRGRRLDCAFPWPSILAGLLRAPAARRRRFGLVAGTDAAPEAAPASSGAGPLAGAPGEADPGGAPAPPDAPAPRRFGVIAGGKGKKE